MLGFKAAYMSREKCRLSFVPRCSVKVENSVHSTSRMNSFEEEVFF